MVTVDVETGKLPGEFSLGEIQVAVKEDVDLSPLSNEELKFEGDTVLEAGSPDKPSD